MASPLKLGHAARYGELARLLLAHRGILWHPEPADTDAELQRDAEELARQLEQLGPTYVKLGQLLSSRVDLLPDAYIEALQRLQDDAEPLDLDVVRLIVEEELGLTFRTSR